MTEQFYNEEYEKIADRISYRNDIYEQLLDLDTDYIVTLEKKIEKLEKQLKDFNESNRSKNN